MKTLFLGLFFLSFNAFAQTLDATEALLTTLPPGNYKGTSLNNNVCFVSVVNLMNRVAIITSEGFITTRSEVHQGADYRWMPGKREFLASVLTTTLTDKRENFVRTIAVEQNTQYVAVGDIITSNRGIQEEVVECVINF